MNQDKFDTLDKELEEGLEELDELENHSLREGETSPITTNLMTKISEYRKLLEAIDKVIDSATAIIFVGGVLYVLNNLKNTGARAEESKYIGVSIFLFCGLLYLIKVLALGLSYAVIHIAENSDRTNKLLEDLINESQDKKSS